MTTKDTFIYLIIWIVFWVILFGVFIFGYNVGQRHLYQQLKKLTPGQPDKREDYYRYSIPDNEDKKKYYINFNKA